MLQRCAVDMSSLTLSLLVVHMTLLQGFHAGVERPTSDPRTPYARDLTAPSVHERRNAAASWGGTWRCLYVWHFSVSLLQAPALAARNPFRQYPSLFTSLRRAPSRPSLVVIDLPKAEAQVPLSPFRGDRRPQTLAKSRDP